MRLLPGINDYDFSNVVISSKQLKLLRRIRKLGKISESKIDSGSLEILSRYKLLAPELIDIGNVLDKTGYTTLSEFGNLYVTLKDNERKDLWLKSAWLPIIVSLLTNLAIIASKLLLLWIQQRG